MNVLLLSKLRLLLLVACGNLLLSSLEASSSKQVSLGTTLVAIPFDKGIVVGADTRTSVGSYVSHRYAHKIVPVSSQCVICRSGSAAATQHLALNVQQHLVSHSYRSGGEALGVAEIAHWLRSRVYEKSSDDVVSLLVAGYDHATQGPLLFSVTPSGALLPEGRFAASGSGSSYVVGYLDDRLSHNSDKIIDQKTAVALCQQALCLAMNRDGSSGGLCRIMVLTAEGRKEFTSRPSSTDATQEGASKLQNGKLEGFAQASEY